MTPLTLEPPSHAHGTDTEADRFAAANLASNVAALRSLQPRVVEMLGGVDDLTWIFARDGYLTAFEPGDRWYTECSVPLLAARAMLKTLDPAGGVACFLDPAHAAQVRVALDHLPPSQALICLVPDMRALSIMLRCDDFASEIVADRLWFVCGENWANEFSALMRDVPGLPSPSRFIRMPNADPAVIDGLIAGAQRVFAEQNASRTATIADLRSRWTSRSIANESRTVCVIARSLFRLWDDAGHALLSALNANARDAGVTCRHFDPDSPANASPLALAMAAAECDAIVAADIARADAATVAHIEMPWITWVTNGQIPAFATAGPNDRLFVTDARWRDAATTAGWPAKRVGVASWPIAPASPSTGEPTLALIADIFDLDVPESLKEYSSHLLLWEKLRAIVARDALDLPEDVEAWVREHARAEAVAIETVDVSLFVNRLIIPAYQQALADTLIKAGLPLRIYGTGWSELPAFRAHAAGSISSREQLHQAANGARAIIQAWPSGAAHPVDALGRPVVRRTGRRRETFVREAALALKGALGTPLTLTSPLSATSIAGLLNEMERRTPVG